MIRLDPGNVVLKPANRRQVMTWLRRSQKLARRFGEFVLTLTLRRTGRHYEARATFTPSGPSVGRCPAFECRVRQYDWLSAFRELIRNLTAQLHARCVQRPALT